MLQRLIKDKLFSDEITKRIMKKEILDVKEFYELIDAQRLKGASEIASASGGATSQMQQTETSFISTDAALR